MCVCVFLSVNVNFTFIQLIESPRGVVLNMLDCDTIIDEFELQLRLVSDNYSVMYEPHYLHMLWYK